MVYEKKDLFRLNNGYILNSHWRLIGFGEEKVIFSAFFNEFDNHYVLQTIREFLYIRKDKDKNVVEPYIKGIKNKNISKKNLFSCCLEALEELVEKDRIIEKQFDKNEKIVNKSVQDYFYQELHTFLDDPKFNEPINTRFKKLF